MFWGERKKETISPNYAAHHLKANSFAYKSEASILHLLHMLLRESITFLSVQNIVRGWHSNVSDIYVMKTNIWQSVSDIYVMKTNIWQSKQRG